MGMYTEVYFRAEVSNEAAEIMRYVSEEGFKASRWILPKHPFFDTERFPMVFSGRSAYFPGGQPLTIVRAADDSYAKYGPDADKWSLVEFRANLKDYDGEIDLFFDWVEPYVRDEGFMGYSLYEGRSIPISYSKGESR